jgi:hypothetical protein
VLQVNIFIVLYAYFIVFFPGMLVLSLLAMMPFSHRSFTIACNNYYNNLSDRSILSSLLGGTLMGLGMTISGSVRKQLLVEFFILPLFCLVVEQEGVSVSNYNILRAVCGVFENTICRHIVTIQSLSFTSFECSKSNLFYK